MSRKRRNTSSPEADSASPSPKRHKYQEPRPSHDLDHDQATTSDEIPYFDEQHGQTGAFPGLGGNDALFYGPAHDGIDYLKMVRSEAKGVPYILTAPAKGMQQGHGQTQVEIEDDGYSYDGTYTAISSSVANLEHTSSLPPAQVRSYESLFAQFRLLQATLRCSPPLSAVESLRSGQLISFPDSTNKVRAQWEVHMLSMDPHPVQLACMDTESVAGLVRFLGGRLEKMAEVKDLVQITRFGAWVWAVLGRCRDRGELMSEEISDLRDLAQQALHLHNRIEGGSAGNDGKDMASSIETAQIPLETLGSNGGSEKLGGDNQERNHALSIVIDVIVTVVGEVYGQRDLLERRKKWPDAG